MIGVLRMTFVKSTTAVGVLSPLRFTRALLFLAVTAVLTVFRSTLLALLMILEPFVSLILSATTILGIAAAIVLEASAMRDAFSFWTMVAFSAGSALLLYAYRATMRLLAR